MFLCARSFVIASPASHFLLLRADQTPTDNGLEYTHEKRRVFWTVAAAAAIVGCWVEYEESRVE